MYFQHRLPSVKFRQAPSTRSMLGMVIVNDVCGWLRLYLVLDLVQGSKRGRIYFQYWISSLIATAETPTFVVVLYVAVKYARYSRKSSLGIIVHGTCPIPTLPTGGERNLHENNIGVPDVLLTGTVYPSVKAIVLCSEVGTHADTSRITAMRTKLSGLHRRRRGYTDTLKLRIFSCCKQHRPCPLLVSSWHVSTGREISNDF